MKKINLYFSLLILIVLHSCNKEAEIGEKNYPYLITNEISNITSTSVVFNGQITNMGYNEIIEYGFLWDIVEPKIEIANKIIIDKSAQIGKYNIKVDFNLFKDSVQYVRAFMKTKTQLIYGNQIKFTCNGGIPVEITSITPLKGYVNKKIVITGKNFSTNKSNVHLFFGDIETEIDSCTNNRIVSRVPYVTEDMDCKITIIDYNKPVQYAATFKAFSYWTKISSFPGATRFGAVSFTVNGKGYVCTGAQEWGGYFSDMYEYDPARNSWSKKADFPGSPRAFAVGFSINEKGYVGFGYSYQTYFHDLWEYDPALDSWTKKNEDIRISTFSDAYFVLNNQFYLFTQNASFCYSPFNNQFIEINMFPGEYRYFSVGLTCDNFGYIIAGQKPGGNEPLKDLWCFNPLTNNWTSKAEIPRSYRDGIAAFSFDNKIFAGLGGIWGGSYLDFYEYNPQYNIWIRLQDFPGDRRELPVSLVIGSKGYIGTGRNESEDELNDFWEFDPNKE